MIDLTKVTLHPSSFDKAREIKQAATAAAKEIPTPRRDGHDPATLATKYSLPTRQQPEDADVDYSVCLDREPVVYDQDGIRITKNTYGALCLNTNSVVFLDIDINTKVFGSAHELEMPYELWRQIEGLGLQCLVYSTYGGYRIVATGGTCPDVWDWDELLDLGDSSLRYLSEQLGVDTKYLDFCYQQKCYRARLTAKPWYESESVGSYPVLQLQAVIGEIDLADDLQTSTIVASHHHFTESLIDFAGVMGNRITLDKIDQQIVQA